LSMKTRICLTKSNGPGLSGCWQTVRMPTS
jgi:hypothetical protein